MSGPYTPSGPWNNGSAPGINMTFLNNLETWIKQVDVNGSSVTLNGATAGSATLYQPLQGNAKLVIVTFSAFRNGSGSAQPLVLPTAFVHGFSIYAGLIAPVQFLSGGSAQNAGIITALSASGGTVTLQTTFNKYSFGDCFSSCDTLSFIGGQSSGSTGIMVLQGV